MRLQVLVSTMNQTNYSLVKKMNIQSDAVIVNQCDKNGIEEFKNDKWPVRWINSTERGLSRSRNAAIRNSVDDVCLISDDDIEYIDSYEKLILDQFKQYPDADIIVFQVEGIEGTFKKYHCKVRELNYLTSMKVASVEITFRLDNINKYGIRFNELFGAGAKYCMGEENIFLFDCLKQGLKIVYVPIKIGNLHLGESTWFRGYNKEYFISKGAAFTGMSKLFSFLFIIQFAIRKYKLFRGKVRILQAVKYMLEGRREYLEKTY
ncbi:Glycosyl transferase family 2 [Hathewaya proteolytica DSM 3090]|uniref:Glycosyl transferase family 2 n=1 Tax=Hathewaya proteolytica DSM 3090 TaxID=1121331 RepID=A0A1M6Q2T2_9CLOT|nr:glycosyltransferase [Hathewaya proteolytica]SHK14437.1 Glycosyl transferase family 2 [Hathewaya proteolytica DSM 3090]